MSAPRAVRSAAQPHQKPNQTILTPQIFGPAIHRTLRGRPGIDPCSDPRSLVDAMVRVYLPGKAGSFPPWCGPTTIVAGDGLQVNWRELVESRIGAKLTAFVNPPWGELDKWLLACELAAKLWELRVLALLPCRPHRVHWEPVRRATARAELRAVTFEGWSAAFAGPCVAVLWDPRHELGDFAAAWAERSHALYGPDGRRLDAALTPRALPGTIFDMARTPKKNHDKEAADDLARLLSLALDEIGPKKPRWGYVGPDPRREAVGRIVHRFGAGMKIVDLEDRLRNISITTRSDLYELEQGTEEIMVSEPPKPGKKAAKKAAKKTGKKTGKKAAKRTAKKSPTNKALPAAKKTAKKKPAAISEEKRRIVVEDLSKRATGEAFAAGDVVKSTGVNKRAVLRVLEDLNGSLRKTGAGPSTRYERVGEIA